ncbi:MAG: alpha/beta hydrolase [Chitinophagales bacterium]|jgi:pimeloyl-ACP methyl ester carboxylesterase|nr:alpha/beta hydrolase [Chitinophagales bacterium]
MEQKLEAWKNLGKKLSVGIFGYKAFTVDIGDIQASANDTLILIHGFPESSYSYAGTIEFLQNRFKRIITWDSLGFGFSDKPKENFTYSLFEHADIALDVWRQLSICGAHVVAHDMGDSILTEILCRIHQNKPYWMKEAILSATFTNGGMVMRHTHMRIGQKILLSSLKGIAAALIKENFAFFKFQIYSAHGNKKLTLDGIQGLFDQFYYNTPTDVIWKVVQYYKERYRFEATRWLPILTQLDIPIHIAWGVDDQNNVKESALYIKAHYVPNAKITMMEGLGHFAQIQDPKRWSKYILDFWK